MAGLHGMLGLLNSLLFLITDYTNTEPNGAFSVILNYHVVCEYAAFRLINKCISAVPCAPPAELFFPFFPVSFL